MDDDLILNQFNDIDEKVDYLIELCKTLKVDNSGLRGKIELLEQEINNRTEADRHNSEQKEIIREKIDGLLEKLSNITELSL